MLITPPKPENSKLGADEVDVFLDYLFRTVARRPARLKLKEAAAVARYLDSLALRVSFPGDRLYLEWLAKLIWGAVLQYGEIPRCEQADALSFLNRHADNYLAWCNPGRASQLVSDTAPPELTLKQLPLKSSAMSTGGDRHPQQTDDLTERIYAAYHALREAKIRTAGPRVAAALNRAGIRTRARAGTSRAWSAYEVGERVKQYERQLKVKRWKRKAVVARWVRWFRMQRPSAAPKN